MKLISQTKNLKLILITPNGEIIVHYDKDFCDESGKPYDLHYQVLYETIKKDLKSYKKLAKKAEKLQGQNMDLIHLMLDIVIYKLLYTSAPGQIPGAIPPYRYG